VDDGDTAMKIFVRAKPGVKKEYIKETTDLFEKNGERHFVVAVAARAVDGKANRAIERSLAEYFAVPASRVRIVSGQTAKEKVIEVA
jgi:hypothetical protein